MPYAKPFGPLSAMTLGNSVQVSRTFDKNYQIAAITAGSILERTYTPDNAGNIAAITDNLDGSRSQNFGYDELGRLTSASGIYGTLGFSYDRTGNRLSQTHSQGTDTYTYVAGTNRLDTITGAQTVNFDHDMQGNLIGRTFVTGTGPPSTDIPDYIYTHDGRRIAKSLPAAITVYHYDIAGQLIAETDDAGNMLKAYVWLNGQPLAMIAADGAVYYFHNDHLGTPQKMTDASGAVVWAADYLPFGQADVTMATVENNLRFAGQYFDNETGLHYNYHRYYDPSLGRYLRADPIGLAGGINPYAYTSNNPVNFIDYYGLIGAGLSGGGSISLFGFRFSAHIEGRLFHDSTKSWRDLSSYNGMVSLSTSYANNYDSDSCNDAGVYGINAEAGFDQLLTNANNYKQIIGDSDSAGFSAGWKSGVDMEVSIMQKNGKDLTLQNGNTIFEISAGLPLYGRNYGLEGHEGVKGRTTGFLGFDFSQ